MGGTLGAFCRIESLVLGMSGNAFGLGDSVEERIGEKFEPGGVIRTTGEPFVCTLLHLWKCVSCSNVLSDCIRLVITPPVIHYFSLRNECTKDRFNRT